MNIALNSKIFSSCSEAFIEPQNPVEPGTCCQWQVFLQCTGSLMIKLIAQEMFRKGLAHLQGGKF